MRRLTISLALALALVAAPALAEPCGPRAVQVVGGVAAPCSGTLISDARAREAAAAKVALEAAQIDLRLARRLAELDRSTMAGMRVDLASLRDLPLWRMPAVAFGAGALVVAIVVALVK